MPQKNRNLIILATALVLCGGIVYSYWKIVLTPIQKSLADETRKMDDLKQKLSLARTRANQLSSIQAEMSALQVDVAELEKLLPKGRELPSLLRLFTHRAETNGLSVTSFRPSNPVAKGLYDEVPYDITAVSSFHNIGHFLTAMGKGDRLFAARNLALTVGGSKTDPSKTVNATFSLIAFKYHE
jgi:type IV pilus assembly protein PilO